MRKKGSTLIETIVSLAVLLLGITLISNLILGLKSSHDYRKLKEEASRITYAIESEIKYNYKKEELESIFLEAKVVELKYDENFLESLLDKELFDFSRGQGIEIRESNLSNNNIKEFTVLIRDIKGVILSERKFYKNNWMDL